MGFEKRAAGLLLFGLEFLDTHREMNADLGQFSYNQEVFGPRDSATRHLDVELPQSFAERREL